MQNDDIQEQFNDAVTAGDRRLAERIARIWLLRLQTATMTLRKSPAPLPTSLGRSVLISAAVELRASGGVRRGVGDAAMPAPMTHRGGLTENPWRSSECSVSSSAPPAYPPKMNQPILK